MKRFRLGEMRIVARADGSAAKYVGETCVINAVDPEIDPLFWFWTNQRPDYQVLMLCDGSRWLAFDPSLKKIPPREEPRSMSHQEDRTIERVT